MWYQNQLRQFFFGYMFTQEKGGEILTNDFRFIMCESQSIELPFMNFFIFIFG